MATFEPNKEILACYAALEKLEKGCIKRTQSLLEYLSTQEKANWIASVRRLKRDMREAKKVMPRKDW
jgi:hypothetical protein